MSIYLIFNPCIKFYNFNMIYFNPNPLKKSTGDCIIRAICAVTNISWKDAFMLLAARALSMCDMPSSNEVWMSVVEDLGFTRYYTCCQTVQEFCDDHPVGTFILGTGSHVIAIIDGDYYDSWDSGTRMPIVYFKKGEE